LLHLTNGYCAIPAVRAAGVDEEILPWHEVLHDGPVPGGLDAAIAEAEPLMLWFEPDLFDLLLLRQLVERLPEDTWAQLVMVGQERWRSVSEVEPV